MKTPNSRRFLALLGLAALAACDQSQPTEPFIDDELLTLDEQVELAVLSDANSMELALGLAAAATDGASMRGHSRVNDSRELNTRARLRFQNAEAALRAGDRKGALVEAREARKMVVRSIEATGGGRAVSSMVERIESMSFTIPEGGDDFDNVMALQAELNQIAMQARGAMARGDTTGAGERAVLGEQRARQRRGHNGRPGDVTAERAEIALALGSSAVALAERLLESGADEEQLRFLATAHEFLEKAREAFANGDYGRAVHFADMASWSALKAVVLPGGVTAEEARSMIDLATELLEDARIAIGGSPTELQATMFDRAGRLIELGEAKIAEGQMRGVGAVWQGAVIASWLAG